MKNIAILASGDGSNAEAIAKYFSNSDSVKVVAVLSNKDNAGVHSRMKALEIPTFTFPRNEWAQPDGILDLLRRLDVDLIVLAGFLCMIQPAIIDAYQGRIINIHPSLLPKFGGAGMWGHHVHEAVIAAQETISGITIHHVTNEVDGGKIIFQASCPVEQNDTPSTLAQRVHKLEHTHYPKVIEQLLID